MVISHVLWSPANMVFFCCLCYLLDKSEGLGETGKRDTGTVLRYVHKVYKMCMCVCRVCAERKLKEGTECKDERER